LFSIFFALVGFSRVFCEWGQPANKAIGGKVTYEKGVPFGRVVDIAGSHKAGDHLDLLLRLLGGLGAY
jgi:hypothetical protein